MANEMCTQEDDAFQQRPPDETKGWFGTGPTYNNYWEKFKRPPLTDLMKWKLTEANESNIPKDKVILDKCMPIMKMNREKLSIPPQDKIQVTWIGHATVLVQLEGLSILCDPVFSEFCGPDPIPGMKRFGYRRYRLAAFKIDEIPRIDAVIISHNHYDHLDKESVYEINKQFKDVTWFVALKTKDWLIRTGIDANTIRELTWWNSAKLELNGKSFEFICTPSQHWCQRGAIDLNKVLWCSWVVKGPTYSYFFGGDTGYHGPLFKEIGNQYGPFDLAAIPIGAYKPRHITKYQHVDPEEAVEIHKDLKSEQSIAIHWGTFELTNEFFLEPPNKVKEHMEKAGLDPAKFISLCLGETWIVGETREEAPFMGVTMEQIKQQNVNAQT